jgi:hypothetical protein
MIVFKAPYPRAARVLILPNPKLGDSYTPVREINVSRSINGTPYTYVKTSTAVRLLFEIEMTRQKSLELEAFLKLYQGHYMQLTDHNSIKYKVIITSELDKKNFKRSVYAPGDPLGSEESVIVNLELEGIPL